MDVSAGVDATGLGGRDALALLETLLRDAADGVLGLDEVGRIRVLNPAAARIVGWEPEALRGQSVKALLPPELGAPHDSHLATFLRTGASPVVGHARFVRVLRKDGSPVAIHLSISDLKLPGQRILLGVIRQVGEIQDLERLEGYAQDLEGRTAELLRAQQEREAAQAALEASERRLRLLLERAPDPILTVDEKQRLVGFNGNAERAFGCPAAEALGRSILDLLPEWEALASQDAPRRETLAKRPDGQSFPAEVSTSLSELAGHRLYTLIVRDVTDRHLAELRIRHFSRELERSNHELDAFAYVASHDLQEPLRKVRSFGERLRERAGGRLDEKSIDYLARMEEAAARMQRLIEDLLAYARVSSAAQPFAPVDLQEVVRGVLSDLEIRISERDATVRVDPLPTIDADVTQMRQVFQNLVGNALKFQREGVRPEVAIRVEPVPAAEPDAAASVRIVVEDNGIGFEPGQCERLFKMFERLHGRGQYEGTGIGLAVCKRIVERHGGRIEAHGEPGRGARFVLRLPLRQPAAETPKEPA